MHNAISEMECRVPSSDRSCPECLLMMQINKTCSYICSHTCINTSSNANDIFGLILCRDMMWFLRTDRIIVRERVHLVIYKLINVCML